MTIADIAWPGPRPLAFDDARPDPEALRRLIGRERELDELLDLCQTHAIVEITAASGVGKTSFVAGARPHLERAGAMVVKAHPWSDTLAEYDAYIESVPQASDAVALYCIALGLPHHKPQVAELPAMLLGQAGDRPLVCIVDQLEELLRYRRMLGRELLQLIGNVAAASGVVHVVIARSEYRNALAPVEVPRAPVWHIALSELTSAEVIGRIISEPIPEDIAVEQAFVDRLVSIWQKARAASASTWAAGEEANDIQECGLLHLQALLWSFRRWAAQAVDVDQASLTVGHLDRYAASRSLTAKPYDGPALMADALLSYVEAMVATCHSEAWPFGPRLMLARSARHLSSAGFKVAQPVSALVSRAMQEELGSARPGHEVELRLGMRSEDGGLADKAKSFVSGVRVVTAGRARSWEPWQVADQMIASLEEALAVLSNDEHANILRRFKHGEDPVYELVHDGIAPALDRWAEIQLAGPMATIGGIAARHGEVFSHHLTADTFLTDGELGPYWGAVEIDRSDGTPRPVLSGIGWHGLGVHQQDPSSKSPHLLFEDLVFRDSEFVGTLFQRVKLRRVVFENCDLRGVAVIDCILSDVTFRNCVMSGAAFNDCEFDGTVFDAGGTPQLLNGLAIRAVQPFAEVTFANAPLVTSLVCTKLNGGRWTFRDVDIRHFVFESPTADEVALTIAGQTTLRHATILAPPGSVVEVDPGVDISPLTDENSVVPPRAVGDAAIAEA